MNLTKQTWWAALVAALIVLAHNLQASDAKESVSLPETGVNVARAAGG